MYLNLNQTELQHLNGECDDDMVGGGFDSFLKSSAKSIASKAKDKAKQKLREKADELKDRAKQEAKKQAYKAFDYSTNKAKDYLSKKQQEYESRQMQGSGDLDGYDTDEAIEILEGAGFESFINKIKKSAKKTGKSIKKSVNKTGKDLKKAGDKIKEASKKVDKATKPLQKDLKKGLSKVGKELEKSAKDKVLKEIISSTLDEALPMAGEALGTALAVKTGNPELVGEIGANLGQVAREKLQEKTGYGVNLKFVMDKYAPKALKDVTNQVVKSGTKVIKKIPSKRNELVKKNYETNGDDITTSIEIYQGKQTILKYLKKIYIHKYIKKT